MQLDQQNHQSDPGLRGIKIRPLSAADMDAACELIGFAFSDNPNALTVAGGDHARARRMTQSAVGIAKLNRKFSQAIVADDGGRLVGLLNSVDWPHCQLRTGEKIRTALAVLPAMGFGLLKQLKISNAWAQHDPGKPHAHLGPIGVHPEFQGRGVGKAMLASFLATVDARHFGAYLETDVDRNVTLYQKFGFKVVARENVNGVDNRFMWRDPHPLK